MRTLIGTIIAGETKLYAVPKFEEMCAAILGDLDVLAVVDGPGRTSLDYMVDDRMRNLTYATEIVEYGKERLKAYALAAGYDALVWQGIDCYYTSRADLDLLLEGAERNPIVGGLVAGRDRENFAVCRQWVVARRRENRSVQ